MKKICILIGFTPNPRIKKRIAVLKQNYHVELIYWYKNDANAYGDMLPDVKCHKIVCDNIRQGLLSRLKQTLLFAQKAGRILKQIEPDFVYVQNLDMLSVACLYLIRRKILIVYEIADIHPLVIDDQKGVKKLFSTALRLLDRNLSRSVDLFVCTSPLFYERYYYTFIPKERMIFIPNMPDLKYFNGFKKKEEGPFTIGFIGLIRFKTQMKMLIDATKGTGIKVFFAGSEIEEGNDICVKNLSSEDHVEYLGMYNYETDIKKLYESADAIYSVYDTTFRDVCIAIPNKYYESIWCELPIIVAKGTYLSELVEEKGVGVSVSDSDIKELRRTLISLAENRELYEKYSANCRKEKSNINPDKTNSELLARMRQIENNLRGAKDS